jgi:uncharacterized membrane protein YoaK (UPF0700 family)
VARRRGDGPRRQWLVRAVLAEATLLLIAAATGWGLGVVSTGTGPFVVIGLTAVGMGLRNATIRHLAEPDMTTTVLTLTLTGLAADSSLAGGTNPRPVRRAGGVAAMLVGAAIGAAMILHLDRPLVWPLVLAAAVGVIATTVWAQHPSSQRPRAVAAVQLHRR